MLGAGTVGCASQAHSRTLAICIQSLRDQRHPPLRKRGVPLINQKAEMKSSSHQTRSLDQRSGIPQPNAAGVGRLPLPGCAAGSATPSGACRKSPSRRQGRRRGTGGSPTLRPRRRRVPRLVGALASREEFLTAVDTVGRALQRGRDCAAPDVAGVTPRSSARTSLRPSSAGCLRDRATRTPRRWLWRCPVRGPGSLR